MGFHADLVDLVSNARSEQSGADRSTEAEYAMAACKWIKASEDAKTTHFVDAAIEMTVPDPKAFVDDEVAKGAIIQGIAEIAGVPSEYISLKVAAGSLGGRHRRAYIWARWI